MRYVFVLTLFLLVAVNIPAAPPTDVEALTAILRDQLLKHLPTPAINTKHDWDRQKEVTVAIRMVRKGPFEWVAESQKALRNDGHWTHLTVAVRDPAKTLQLELKDVQSPEDGKITFTAILAADVDLKFEQQVWKAGVRLLSNETRAKCRATVKLTCEATNRVDTKPGSFLPDLLVRLRVTAADLTYDNFVVEHTLGVGGDAAKAIGEATRKLLAKVKPSVERDLLAKANLAIVKAGDTKEVRVGLSTLLKK